MSNVIHAFDTELGWDEEDELDHSWVDTVDPNEEIKRLAQEEINLKIAMDGIKKTKQDLAARERRLHARMEKVKQCRRDVQAVHNMSKVVYPEFTVCLRGNGDTLKCVDREAVPEEFRRHSWTEDKAAVNKHFKKTGEVPPGYEVEEGKSTSVILTQ
jgi:hypothetical protein